MNREQTEEILDLLSGYRGVDYHVEILQEGNTTENFHSWVDGKELMALVKVNDIFNGKEYYILLIN